MHYFCIQLFSKILAFIIETSIWLILQIKKGFFIYNVPRAGSFQSSVHHTIKSHIPLKGLGCCLSSVSTGLYLGIRVFRGVSSTEAGRPSLVVKQLARCFPSHLGRAVLGLNSAALGELPATGL